jgi:DNA modification methylase
VTTPSVDLRFGDNRDILRSLPDESVSAIICDPPYEIAFMGRQWDASGIAYDVDLWRECLRVAKPGAHLAAFGGTRTYHRLAVAIEDAGWEIRDSLMWLYGSGMNKSLDVSKAIDKQRDDNPERRAVGAWLRAQRETAGLRQKDVAKHWPSVTGGLTGCVANWEHGFNLPTWEQWRKLRDVVGFGDEMDAEVWRLNGRKGTPGEAWGQREIVGRHIQSRQSRTSGYVGDEGPALAWQHDITAPATSEAKHWQGWGTALAPAHEPIVLARKPLSSTVARTVLDYGTGAINVEASRTDEGRWPKNVIIDEHVAADLSTRARYFYCAKAPTSERPTIDGKGWPTVKPLSLMRWLVRLLTPPGGLVVDPFAGTGTTLQAARDEGFPSLGAEADEFAYQLARQRLNLDAPPAVVDEPLSLFDVLDGKAS